MISLRRLKLGVVTAIMVLGATITAYAGSSSDPLTATNTSNSLYERLNTIRTQGLSPKATDVQRELLEDVYDEFTDAANNFPTPDNVQFYIQWGDSSNKVLFDGIGNSSENYKNLEATISTLQSEAGQVESSKTKSIDDTKKAIKDINGLVPPANIQAGKSILEPFMPLLQRIMGGIIVGAVLLLGVITSIDILYLLVQPLHAFMDSSSEASGYSGTTKGGALKVRFISDDAVDAYKAYTENQKNPLLAYLKKRTVTYIAAALVIYLSASGNMGLIINVVLNLFDGIITTVAEALPTS